MISFNVTAGNTVYVLSMLEPGDYLVRVRAYNMYGQGPDSDTEVFSISKLNELQIFSVIAKLHYQLGT